MLKHKTVDIYTCDVCSDSNTVDSPPCGVIPEISVGWALMRIGSTEYHICSPDCAVKLMQVAYHGI